jgi:hypothetical protein
MSTASARWSLSDDICGLITDAKLGYGDELLLGFGDRTGDGTWLVSSQSSPWYTDPLGADSDLEEIALRLKNDTVNKLDVSPDGRSLELRLGSGGRLVIAGDRSPDAIAGSLWQVFDPHGVVWTAYGDGSVRRTHADAPLALSDREQLELEVRRLERGFDRLTRWGTLAAGATALAAIVLLALVIGGTHVSTGLLTGLAALFPALLFLVLTRLGLESTRGMRSPRPSVKAGRKLIP